MPVALTTMPPSELMLELGGLFPMTWLFPERRRIVPLGSTLPFSLTRRMFGATPLSPAEVPGGTMVASTRVAFAGTSTSTLMRETFWTVAPGSGAGKGDGGAGLDGDLEGLTGADGFRCVDDDRAGL